MTLATESRAADANVSLHLRRRAAEHPERCAVRTAGGGTLSFGGLDARCDAIAHGLVELGLAPGDRACLFVRPGPELIALTHAFFRTGVVPVLIDPGMGRRSLLSCVERIRPRALVGVPRVHVARLAFPRAFRSVDVCVTVGRRLGWGGSSLADLERSGARRGAFSVPAGDPEREAAVLFTSGSTGPAKGVVYTHTNFAAQLNTLAELYALEPGEVDCACFPLFGLFDNALGMTSVFPQLDPSRPGSCDPRAVFAAIESTGATFTFGSPAIWRRVLRWAERKGRRFTRLRRLAIAGAPVPPWLVAGLRRILPAGGEVHTPYGATEALPVSNAAGADIERLRTRVEGGEGSYVGRPLSGVEVALVRVTDARIDAWSDDLRVGPGEPGEICVRGPIVTRAYKFDPEATSAAKIAAGARLWHRMGDVGRLDADGRLWILGRKAHRVETAAGTLFPVPLENAFEGLAGIHRTALVGVGPRGNERPHLIVERGRGADRRAVERAVRARAQEVPDGARIEGVLYHASFPVDVRHNAKIDRGILKRWAEGQLS